jgi:ATP-dependent Clp protease ATP-binding subunit ClpA
MFSSIKRRLGDMATIKSLCLAALRHANAEGKQQPGAEHFVLAALELPDGSASATFRRLRADPAQFKPAVEAQYREALASFGIGADEGGQLPQSTPVAPAGGVYRAGASGQALMQELAALDKAGRPLLGAHVLVAASAAQQGVAARALRAMGISPQALNEAAQAEIQAHG